MKPILFPILACSTVIVLASCASVPTKSPLADLAGAAPVTRLSTAQVDQFALDLAAAVAEQNAVAYEAPSTVIDASTDGAGIGLASAIDDPSGDPDAFEELLSPTTESTMDSQAALQSETSDAIANADISVDEIVVGVQDLHTEQVAATSVVTVDLYIGRDLDTGVLWEEVIPYVSTIDASGTVIDLVVQDDSWALGLQSPPEPDLTGIDPDVLEGRVPEQSVEESVSIAPASLASQAMYAGGWTMVTGLYSDDHYWWHSGNPVIPKSYAWADAQDFYDFAYLRSGRVTKWASVYDLRTGDILQYDITTSGMNHTMIVTSKVGSEPYLTYHTSNTHNKPFSAVYTAVVAQDSTPVWFSLKV